jgi:DNA invertase Pin-like site-specific DNA recombinase
MTTIGYARVSTDGQTLDARQSALRDAGATRVFSEKVSGAKTDRAQLAKAMAALAEGDTLVVRKLDRLGEEHQGLAQHSSRYCRCWRYIQISR